MWPSSPLVHVGPEPLKAIHRITRRVAPRPSVPGPGAPSGVGARFSVAHLFWPGYGSAFLELVASVYPGYRVGGFGEVIVGTLYALLDGAVCGVVIGWLYNAAARAGATRD